MIKQEWPETLTRVEIATHVRDHMLQQGKRAVDNSGCRYRTDDGLACAIGCLLTDAEAARVAEGYAFNLEAVSKGEIAVPDRLLPHLALIGALQIAHDGATDINNVVAECERVIAGGKASYEGDLLA